MVTEVTVTAAVHVRSSSAEQLIRIYAPGSLLNGCFSRPSLQTVDAIHTSSSSVPFALRPVYRPRLRRVLPILQLLTVASSVSRLHFFTNYIVASSHRTSTSPTTSSHHHISLLPHYTRTFSPTFTPNINSTTCVSQICGFRKSSCESVFHRSW